MNAKIRNVVAAAACGVIAAAAFGAIIIDDDGVGFVGKGDVQLAFGWNNAELQACVNGAPAAPGHAGCLKFEFFVDAMTETVATWTCTKDNGNTQEREHTVTTTMNAGGVSATVARSKNQVSGFNLNGGPWYASTQVVASDGPAKGSCPTSWTASNLVETDTDLGSVKRLRITDTRSNVVHSFDLD